MSGHWKETGSGENYRAVWVEDKPKKRTLYDRSKGEGHGGIYKTTYHSNQRDKHPNGRGYQGDRIHMNRRDGTHFAVNGDGSNPHEAPTKKKHR